MSDRSHRPQRDDRSFGRRGLRPSFAVVLGGAFEGFGLTYLEANAYGKPVVGTLDCGAEDAIADGENGVLVPQRDPAAVAGAILRLLDDPAAARAMGERGRQRALGRDWSRVVDEYLAIYDRVLTPRRRS